MNRRRGSTITDKIRGRARTMMKWRTRSVQSRADISFFIFIMFFAVFGIIVLTELLFLERHNETGGLRLRFYEALQDWEMKVESDNSNGDEQPPPPPPARVPLDGHWQPVAGTRFRFYVYSAYVERRTVSAVRVVAATKTRGADPVLCRVWLRNNNTIEVKARVQTIRENWNMQFSAVFVLCPLSGAGVRPEEAAGSTVAVVAEAARHRLPTNLLIVHDTEPKSDIENNIHVCVKPFHYDYGRDEWLLEWMEVNRLLGVTHFYMYNNTLGNTTSCILDNYRKQGLVTMLPWHLPFVSKIEIRTEGQFAAFNDCLYRSMSNASWLLVIDVDEVVFPKQERTLIQLLTSLADTYKAPIGRTSAFIFRNAFFYVQWDDDPEAPVPLMTARKTRRWATPHGLKNRSKYAVRPYEAVELGNHFLWEHAPGSSSVGVRIDRAVLHHYREICEFGGTKCLSVPSVVDRTAHRWTIELAKKIEEQKNLLSDVCLTNLNKHRTASLQPAVQVKL